MDVFCHQKRVDVAERVRDLAQQTDSTATGSTYVLNVFSQYLIDCYTNAHHPCSLQWPFSSFRGYVSLELCHTPIYTEEDYQLKNATVTKAARSTVTVRRWKPKRES